MKETNVLNEEWRPVFGYEGLYDVSNLGRIRSLPRFVKTHACGRGYFTKQRIIKRSVTSSGYFWVHLCKNGVSKPKAVHRVVAESFIHGAILPSSLDVHHKDHNKLNNIVSNLEVLSEKQHNIVQFFNRVQQRSRREKEEFDEFADQCLEHQREVNDEKLSVNFAEEWADIPGWEGAYQVSTYGGVRSVDRFITRNDGAVLFWKGQLMSSYTDQCGQIMVKLNRVNEVKTLKVSRLVAKAFLPNLSNKRDVHHKDGDKTNNRVDNLEWLTRQEHFRKDKLTGKFDSIRGSNGTRSRFSSEQIMDIRKLYESRQFTQTDIAKQYNCPSATISCIVNYKTWKHI
jgi:hypothetical protein